MCKNYNIKYYKCQISAKKWQKIAILSIESTMK